LKYPFQSREEMEDLIKNEVLTTSEVKEILNITTYSRFIWQDYTHKKTKNASLFFRMDVMN
jgi:hypothetical protein